ncbi:MBL fold metallo-hydrolase [Cellulomonas bogoriensis]
MAYTGDVVVHGPSDTRTLDALVIRKASVGPMDNNTYLLTCRHTGRQLLIDAAADPERLLGLVREGSRSATLESVVTTHRHRDHHDGLESLVAVTGARSFAGTADAHALPVTTEHLRHGDVITVGQVALEVISLRGHTPGSVALAYHDPAAHGGVHLFTGDSLFPGGPGKTATPGDFEQLMNDLEQRVFGAYDDTTWVYPGHGRDTTLGAERPALGEWRARGW